MVHWQPPAAAGHAFVAEGRFEELLAEPVRIVRADPERGGKDASLAPAYLVRGIERVGVRTSTRPARVRALDLVQEKRTTRS